MSYTEERDEIAKLFGQSPEKKKGYSSEAPPLEETPAVTQPPAPTPVPLAPPASTEPLSADESAPIVGADTVIEDEEILVYEDSGAPDFGSSDFYNFDGAPEDEAPSPSPSPAPPAENSPSPVNEEQAPVPAPAPAAPVEVAATPHARISEPKTTAAPPAEQPATKAEPATVAQSPQTPPGERTFVREESREPVDQKELLLDTHGLVKIYDGRTVVNGVDINVRPGEIVGLLGPNGAGKTTSFYMIVGLVPPNGGKVLFDGKDVTSRPMYQRARLGMGYLPQEESIFRKLTVEENIMAVMETLSISKKEKKARCQELLERFSITHIRKNIALTCSGGEKRRVTIARSLVTNPKLLMLDEPFSGVDPIAVNEIQSIVQDLRESGLAILITDHNARQTLELVDRAYLIYEGKVLREGSRDFLINDPVSRELYLGDRFTM